MRRRNAEREKYTSKDSIMSAEMDNKKIADLLYGDLDLTVEELERQYPPRELPEGAFVTRFAPSPTGFVHIGGIYASLVSKRLAEQTNGVFFLRIEDTDQKREVAGGTQQIIETMNYFGVGPTEGVMDAHTESGEYGPYIQSHRKDIYTTYAKWMVEHGFAYPCFCTEEELLEIAKQQEISGEKKGYYGKWAKSRNLSVADIEANIKAGKSFVLRVKSPEQSEIKKVNDLIRGEIRLESNTQDMVLIKSNGIPTYHFAHVVDDHLMRTTHVTRGEEWLSSLSLHIQLFEMLGMEIPTFVHFSHIGKKEGGSIRKLSKRKDPEAAMAYYVETGYPPIAIIEYLLSLASPGFLDWRKANPDLDYTESPVDPRKMSKSISLFDQAKLDFISREAISRFTAEEVYLSALAWAQNIDPEFADILQSQPDYAMDVFNIERNQENPRKDFAHWSDLRQKSASFFDELTVVDELFHFPENIGYDEAHQFLARVYDSYDVNQDKETWLDQLRTIAEEVGYARDARLFKAQPENYKGQFGQIITVLRIAITGQSNTPDLYQVMKVLGQERVMERISAALDKLA